VGFEVTWRQIDDQTLDFATPDRLQLARDQLDMRRELKDCPGCNS
jgi:hypothetical protein